MFSTLLCNKLNIIRAVHGFSKKSKDSQIVPLINTFSEIIVLENFVIANCVFFHAES